MALFSLYTAVRQFIGTLLGVSLVLLWGSFSHGAESCGRIFVDATENSSAFPPKSWTGYLKSMPVAKTPVQPMGSIPREFVQAPREDSRLYTMGSKYFAKSNLGRNDELPGFIQADIQAEVAAASTRYEYISSHSPQGGPYTFRTTEWGGGFEVPDLPRRNEFPNQATYSKALHKYLDRIVAVIKSGKTYPEYDAIFDSRRLEWDASDRAEMKAGVNLARGRSYTKESRVTEVPVESVSGTNLGRIAFREEYDRGDMVVIVVGTKFASKAQVSSAAIAKGKELQKSWVIELISEIYPEYVERRHWGESFIKADFSEVLETLNSTDYVMVRKKDSGELLAAMGLNRASYGKAQIFNADAGKWVEYTGKFGSTIFNDYPTAQSDRIVDPSLIRENKVPLLKMEAYLGEGFRMPRPALVEGITMQQVGPRVVNGEFVGRQPVYLKAGEIYEPVKFFMAKSAELRAKALNEVFAETIQTMFPENRSCDLSVCGQALYTFNPKTEGSRLYAKRGMGVLTEFPSADKDGVDWHVFGSKVESYLQKYHEPSAADKEEAGSAVQRINNSRELSDRVLEFMNGLAR
ncbi:hypothetical protein [Bdellovibrio sp. ZAP7]|uniref:hypothetical protein n=1 Tax=Bdellovibrio sp. ZAP7 TaxID=2231053 RepID=UPI00143D1633|nr:hypothetical protein [Bdellovibrio sp. ZAP7]